MTEVEKEESQKTVVSFITGLLIGGLLVWIFSSTPEEKKEPAEEKQGTTETAEKVEKVENKGGEESKTTTNANEVKTEPVKKLEVGKGALTVNDQAAGDAVVLGSLTFPVTAGWVVVRDDLNGTPGNVLGAARFSTEEGLSPSMVELIRKTEAGKSYQVMFYSQEGSAGFALGEDKPIDNMSVVFKAQ